jgi:hypothetical protein
MKSKIFIVYNLRDRDIAIELANQLHNEGFDIWIFELNATFTNNKWEREVYPALMAADKIVLALGKHGLGESGRREWRDFWVRRKDAMIIPVLLPGGSIHHASLPGILVEKEWVILEDDSHKFKNFQELLKRLRPKPGGL